MYRRLGLDRAAFAKEFRITERTALNWEAGKTRIPYAAFKLLRLLLRDELPGWSDWRFEAGQLVSPEGHRYGPKDFSWLSLTVRQAKASGALYAEHKAWRLKLEAAQRRISVLEILLATPGRRLVDELDEYAPGGVRQRRSRGAPEGVGFLRAGVVAPPEGLTGGTRHVAGAGGVR